MSQVSIFLEQNIIGVSYYDPKQNRIFCYQINVLKEEEYLFNLFLQFENIIVLIIPLNFNEDFVQSVKHRYFQTQNKHLNIQRVLNCEYNFESCISKILQLNFDRDLNESLQNNQQTMDSKNLQQITEQYCENFRNQQYNKYQILCQQIDLEQKNLIKSLGGLLCFLLNNQIVNLNYSFFDIVFLKNINKQLHYNLFTLSYLNIFKEDIHPSMIKGKGQTKEGFSLFMLFSKFLYTKLGMLKLRHLFLTPQFDLSILKLRNQSIEFFYSQSGECIKKIKLNLQKCSNIKKVLCKLKQVQMNFNDWYCLKITLQSTLNIMSLLLRQNETPKERELLIFKHFSMQLFQELQKLNQFLDKYLSFSPKEGEIMINEGIVQELDDLLKIYENLDEILNYYNSQELIKLTNNNSNFNSQMMIQYFPQLGFFITIQNCDQYDSEPQIDDKINFSQKKDSQQSNYSLQQDCCENSKEQKKNVQKSDQCFYFTGKQFDDNEIEGILKDNQKQINQSPYNQLQKIEKQNNCYINTISSNNSLSTKNQVIEKSQNLQKKYCLTDDYSYCFTLQDALLFKNNLCYQLDIKYGDIQSRIIDIQRDILREIEQQILLYSEEINTAQEFVSDLDLYFCLYQAAEAYNLRKPKFTQDSSLILYEMRNILTEITIGEKQFVSNSFCVKNFAKSIKSQKIFTNNMLDSQFSNRFTFITGPNYAGKSVFLKSIGMIVYLAHIGSFIPCRFARIGMIDNIFVNTCQHDSVLKFNGESAQQLQCINYILNQATNRSLILIDEFGKNFRLNDSLNLNQSLIKCLTEDTFQEINEDTYQKKYLLFQNQNIFSQNQIENSSAENITEAKQQNFSQLDEFQFMHQEIQNVNLIDQYNKIPITLMASHLSQLVNQCGLRESYLIRFAQMEVLIQKGKNICKLNELNEKMNAMQKIVHVYKLSKGLSLKSCSSLVAKNIFRDNDFLIRRIVEINQFILEEKFQIQPLQNVEQIHLEKVQKVINILNFFKDLFSGIFTNFLAKHHQQLRARSVGKAVRSFTGKVKSTTQEEIPEVKDFKEELQDDQKQFIFQKEVEQERLKQQYEQQFKSVEQQIENQNLDVTRHELIQKTKQMHDQQQKQRLTKQKQTQFDDLSNVRYYDEAQLTKKIRQCKNGENLFRLYNAHKFTYTTKNLVHTLTKYTQLVQQNKNNKLPKLDRRFMSLIMSLQSYTNMLQNLEKSMILWSLCKLNIQEEIVEKLIKESADNIKQLTFKQISILIWVMAKFSYKQTNQLNSLCLEVGLRLDDPLVKICPQDKIKKLTSQKKEEELDFEDLEQALELPEEKENIIEPQSLSMFLWSLGKLGVYDEDLMKSAINTISNQIDQFTPLMITQILYSFSNIKYKNKEVFEGLCDILQKKGDQLKEENVLTLKTLIVSLCRLKIGDKKFTLNLTKIIIDKTNFKKNPMSPRFMSEILYSLSKRYIYDEKIYNQMAQNTIQVASSMNIKDCSESLYAFSKYLNKNKSLQQAIQIICTRISQLEGKLNKQYKQQIQESLKIGSIQNKELNKILKS
ncbi:hypothetical protein ABPG72_009233 [Tetrahymena utriculariae]